MTTTTMMMMMMMMTLVVVMVVVLVVIGEGDAMTRCAGGGVARGAREASTTTTTRARASDVDGRRVATVVFVFKSMITSRRGRYHPSMASDRDRESPQSRPSIPSCLKNIPSRFASRSRRRPPVEPCTKAPFQPQSHPRSA